MLRREVQDAKLGMLSGQEQDAKLDMLPGEEQDAKLGMLREEEEQEQEKKPDTELEPKAVILEPAGPRAYPGR